MIFSQSHNSKTFQIILTTLLFLSGVFFIYNSILEGIPNIGSDFEQDHAAAVYASKGLPIYGFFSLEQGASTPFVRVNHPPIVSLLFYPLANLTLDQAYVVFVIISLIIFSIALFILGGSLELSRINRFSLIAVAFIWWPTLFAVKVGALSLLIASLIIIGWCLDEKKYFKSAAFCYALAIHLKIFPAIFFITFLCTKRFRHFLWTCFWILSLLLATILLVGFQTILDFVNVVLLYPGHASNEILNLSYLGISERLFGVHKNWIRPIFDTQYAATIGYILSATALVDLIFFSIKKDATYQFSFALACGLMILASPVSWSHHVLFLIVPLSILFKDQRKLFWPVVTLLFLSFPDLLYIRSLQAIGINAPWSALMGFFLNLPTVGIILLEILLIKMSFQELSSFRVSE